MSLNNNNFEQLWTVEEVAAFYRVCAKTIRRKIVELEIPTVNIGRQIRIRATHVPLFAQKKW
ncbi:helix-turn-helix domain-containing protein [Hyphomicrobium sp.]|uniref:helix-turn-helix domain-containing protein n=1 Tax=Hyphomicrobium sp. TaxID=82 RepID=UPI003F71083E